MSLRLVTREQILGKSTSQRTHSKALWSRGGVHLCSRHQGPCVDCRILGVVTHTDKRGAYVDVGGKMSAFIQTDDITLGPLQKVGHGALSGPPKNSMCSVRSHKPYKLVLPA